MDGAWILTAQKPFAEHALSWSDFFLLSMVLNILVAGPVTLERATLAALGLHLKHPTAASLRLPGGVGCWICGTPVPV